ncbi:MAG: hypothetical protein BWY69_00284 [Planctomycetes bacterium ADurb.Bin401]|nr:MAG: hypothetical protein BWY69_00284 [Planctomycetes bacterium ADurb.Bin401]
MKRALIMFLFSISSAALAQDENKIGFTLTGDFYSKYVWRGQLLNDDFVFQPNVTASYKEFSLNAWGNMGLTDYNKGLGYDSGEFTEYDFTLSYSGKFNPDGKLGYTVGVIHYQFPSSFLDTTEIFWGLTFDTFLNPYVTVYHDIDEAGGGIYANTGISHTFEKVINISNNISADLVLAASIGWGNAEYNEWYWGAQSADSRLNDLVLKAALPFSLPGDWSIAPSISFITLVDGNLRDADTYATNSDYFVAGISISKSF